MAAVRLVAGLAIAFEIGAQPVQTIGRVGVVRMGPFERRSFLAVHDPSLGPDDGAGGAKPGRIAWFSIFASGLVVGLILGLGLTPQGLTGAARQLGQVSSLWGSPADRPMAQAVQPSAVAPADPDKTAPPPPPANTTAETRPASLYAASEAAEGQTETADLAPSAPLDSAPAVLSKPAADLASASGPVSSPVFAPALLGDHPLTLGVFGDSLADGLWAGLYRQMRDGKHMDVVKFSQPATGLSRYDYVNIQQKTEGQLAKRHVDIAVVLFGTNDQQGIVEGGKVRAFGTPEWKQAYGARIDALVTLLRRQGATVYWVGLPKMRSDSFDQKAQLINGVCQQHMAALGVRFIPTDGASEDTRGAYAAYLPVGASGKMTLMRANDGIHMSMPGYLRIAAPVSASIRADLSQHAGPAVSAAEGLGR